MNELSNNDPASKLPEDIELLADYFGITDETIDEFEARETERTEKALKRWKRLLAEILAGE